MLWMVGRDDPKRVKGLAGLMSTGARNRTSARAGAGSERKGAVAAGRPPVRRRRLLPLLLAALAVLGLIALILALSLGGGSSKHKHAAAKSSGSAAGAGQVAGSGSGSANTASGSGAANTAGLPKAGLIGGGGIAPKPASGALAPSGSVGAILFAENSAALDAKATAVVATAAREIKAHHARAVNVVGYTNAIGNPATNRALSLRRGRAVISALRERLGGTTPQFSASARGEAHPVAPNSTPRGRQLNRRVVIFASR
jgi:outer membrane protein OmpA-like peptidoglycan-associated protein